jgi:hypothetical protein
MRGDSAVAPLASGVVLRDAISRPGAFDAAAAELADVLSGKVSDHIRRVYERLERAVDEELAPSLRLTVLVHEVAPDHVPALLDRIGLPDFTPIVTSIVHAFGRLWKLRSDDDLADFVRAHEPCLAPLLLFELAHEGAPTVAMRRIARLAGLERSFEGWAARLVASLSGPTRS